jgi:hypothetical protein
MKRVFTKTVSPRYEAGQIHDWPMTTWNGVADSVRMALDTFTKPVTDSTFIDVAEGYPAPAKRRSEKD